jgi:NAD+ diphosphatase
MNFISRNEPPGPGRGPAYAFIFQGDRLLVRSDGDRAHILTTSELSQFDITLARDIYLGYLEDEHGAQTDCYGGEFTADAPIPDTWMADGLRQLYPLLGDQMFAIAGRAVQVVAWDRTHRYCGQCGAATETLSHERAKRCPSCGLLSYPRISPAIIIAVVRRIEEESRILLARNHRFPTGRYSVLAGYVEPGETLEECARREVSEEVGIDIKNIRYFGSQPWPFPNSLMIGFTAEYAGGEISLEEGELADARWFTAGALPDLPPKMTIARRLIDWFAGETAS